MPTALSDSQGQALRVLKKILPEGWRFFSKTLTAEPHPPERQLSLSLFSFLF